MTSRNGEGRSRISLALLAAVAAACAPDAADPALQHRGASIVAPGSILRGGVDAAAISELGSAVGFAGDVNGDGYGDLWVGDEHYQVDGDAVGALFVWYGSDDGPGPAPDVTRTGPPPPAMRWRRFASAGDVNGDGYSDLLAGAPSTSYPGAAYLFLGGASGLSPVADWSWTTPTGGDTGADLTAGDFNGDGYSDVVVATPAAEGPTGTVQGACFVFDGGPSGLAAAPSVEIWGTPTFSNHWCDTAEAVGDVQGDGFDDLLVGDDRYNNNKGHASLYYGSALGLTSAAAWTTGSGGNSQRVGNSLSAAGDVNGDGFADLLIGGSSYWGFDPSLYYGSAAGPVSPPTELASESGAYGTLAGLGDINGDGFADIATSASSTSGGGLAGVHLGGPGGVGTSPDQTWSGAVYARFGQAVGGAGDVNGDGLADFLVGSPDSDQVAYGGGAAFLYYGAAAGRSESPTWELAGTQSGEEFGRGLAIDGDVDGDGFDDLLVGAWKRDTAAGAEAGSVSFHPGGTGGPAPTPSWSFDGTWAGGWLGYTVALPGDLDGDGYTDVAVGCLFCGAAAEGSFLVFSGGPTGPSTTPTHEFTGTQADEQFGGTVAGAGDVDADGLADLLVGAAGWDGPAVDTGAAHLWLGDPAGLAAAPDWTFEGTLAGAFVGNQVSGARDFNGDGFDDLIVAGPHDGVSLVEEGKVYLFLGGSSGPAAAPALEVAGQQAGAQLGYSVSWLGDVDRDGYDDFAAGAAYYDGNAADGGAVFVFSGEAVPSTTTPDSLFSTSLAGARRGYTVRGGGDAAADGYPSLVDGAPDWDTAGPVAGALHEVDQAGSVAFGELWLRPGDESYAAYGTAVAGGGDLDGDGFDDLVLGKPFVGAGEVQVFAGNRADVDHNNLWDARPGAFQPGTPDRIAPQGRSSDQVAFDLALRTGAPYGRTRATLEYEVKPTGLPFDAADATFDSAAWTEVGCTVCLFDPVRELTAQLGGLTADTPYRWRARVRYDPSQARPTLWSRWYYGGRAADWDGVHVRTALADADEDGWPELGDPPDCDDDDPLIHPGATETCDGVDEDCDGQVDDGFDVDGDGFTTCGPDGVAGTDDDDCDDADADAFPDALEACDGDLESCGADVDEPFDADGDGSFDAGEPACVDAYGANTDCDDSDATIFPGAAELCDGVDQDCDGSIVDEDDDLDGDGVPDCEDPDIDGDGDDNASDCRPQDPAVYTGAEESCDEVDSDCDGSFVDGFTNTDNNPDPDLPDCVDPDDDDDGWEDDEDCEPQLPAIHPEATELCDDVDSDCDGSLVDEFTDLDGDGTPDCVDTDADGDGHPPPGHGGGDCDDLDAAVYPFADEICDGADTDCDGDIPGGEEDLDADGWPICADDCDDQDATVNPGAEEIAGNGKDDDCDGDSAELPGADGRAVAPGCSCEDEGAVALLPLLLLAGLPVGRRRRRR